MNRKNRRALSRTNHAQAWLYRVSAHRKTPSTPEEVTQIMLPVYAALHALRFGDVDDEHVLRLIEMFAAGDSLTQAVIASGADGAKVLFPTFECAANAVAEIACRKPRRGTGAELRTITEGVDMLDQLIAQAPAGLLLQSLRAAADMADKVYRSHKK